MTIVLQEDIQDCGPCALKSIIEYYKGYVPLEKIKEDCYTSNEGTTVYHLTEAAKKYGFDAVAKRIDGFDNKELALPIIVHIKYSNGLTHFMALYSIKNNKMVLMDPAKGKVNIRKEEFAKIFTGIVIELVPKNTIIKIGQDNSLLKFFFNIFKSNKKICLYLFTVSIFSYLLIVGYSFYFKVLNNSLVNQLSFNIIKYEIYLFLIILLLKQFLNFYKIYYQNILEKNIDANLFSQFISHIFKLPLNVICNKTSGEIISRIEELNNVKALFVELFFSGTLDLIMSLISISALILVNYRLSLILLICAIIYILFSMIINPYLYERVKKNIDLQTESNIAIMENINSINSIKNLNLEKTIIENIEYKIGNLIYDNYDFNIEYNLVDFIRDSFCEIILFIINVYGFYLIFNGTLTFVDLVIFNTISSFFMDPIKNIVNLFSKYNYLRASFNKICDFINMKEEMIGEDENFSNGDIEFKNIYYSYDGYHKVLDNFNLYIKKGSKILLKGKSGSGKSTICYLLRRIYNATSGKILINEKNINDYSLKTLRKNITYVGQKERVVNDTIKNNIVFNRKTKNFDLVCKICNIENIVQKKAFRYESAIDNNSSNISGGEKQRIILARALLEESQILILDEALSEVDYYQEKQIIKQIIKYYPLVTLIYITHKNHDSLFERTIDISLKERYDI